MSKTWTFDVPDAAKPYYEREHQERLAEEELQAKHGSTIDTIIAGVEGIGRGLTMGLSDVAETVGKKDDPEWKTALKLTMLAPLPGLNTMSQASFGKSLVDGEPLKDPENIEGRRQASPIVSTVGEIVGGAIPAVATGGSSLGATAGKTALQAAGNVALREAGLGAVQGAGSILSREARNDPTLDAEAVAAEIGVGALLGGVLGGAGSMASSGVRSIARRADRFGANRQIESIVKRIGSVGSKTDISDVNAKIMSTIGRLGDDASSQAENAVIDEVYSTLANALGAGKSREDAFAEVIAKHFNPKTMKWSDERIAKVVENGLEGTSSRVLASLFREGIKGVGIGVGGLPGYIAGNVVDAALDKQIKSVAKLTAGRLGDPDNLEALGRRISSTAKGIEEAVDGPIGTGGRAALRGTISGVVNSDLLTDDDVDMAGLRARELMSNPQAMLDVASRAVDEAGIPDELRPLAVTSVARGIETIGRSHPGKPAPTRDDPTPSLDPESIDRVRLTMLTVWDPVEAFYKLADGSITDDELQALKETYPALSAHLIATATDSMIENGQTMPPERLVRMTGSDPAARDTKHVVRGQMTYAQDKERQASKGRVRKGMSLAERALTPFDKMSGR